MVINFRQAAELRAKRKEQLRQLKAQAEAEAAATHRNDVGAGLISATATLLGAPLLTQAVGALPVIGGAAQKALALGTGAAAPGIAASPLSQLSNAVRAFQIGAETGDVGTGIARTVGEAGAAGVKGLATVEAKQRLAEMLKLEPQKEIEGLNVGDDVPNTKGLYKVGLDNKGNKVAVKVSDPDAISKAAQFKREKEVLVANNSQNILGQKTKEDAMKEASKLIADKPSAAQIEVFNDFVKQIDTKFKPKRLPVVKIGDVPIGMKDVEEYNKYILFRNQLTAAKDAGFTSKKVIQDLDKNANFMALSPLVRKRVKAVVEEDFNKPNLLVRLGDLINPIGE